MQNNHESRSHKGRKILTLPIEIDPLDHSKIRVGNYKNTPEKETKFDEILSDSISRKYVSELDNSEKPFKNNKGEDEMLKESNPISEDLGKKNHLKSSSYYDTIKEHREEYNKHMPLTTDTLKESIKDEFRDLARDMNNEDRLKKERAQRTIENSYQNEKKENQDSLSHNEGRNMQETVNVKMMSNGSNNVNLHSTFTKGEKMQVTGNSFKSFFKNKSLEGDHHSTLHSGNVGSHQRNIPNKDFSQISKGNIHQLNVPMSKLLNHMYNGTENVFRKRLTDLTPDRKSSTINVFNQKQIDFKNQGLCMCQPGQLNCKCNQMKPEITANSVRRQTSANQVSYPMIGNCLPGTSCQTPSNNFLPMVPFPHQYHSPMIPPAILQQRQTVQNMNSYQQSVPFQTVPMLTATIAPQVLNNPPEIPTAIIGGSISNICLGECASGTSNNCYNPMCMCSNPPCKQLPGVSPTPSQPTDVMKPIIQDPIPYLSGSSSNHAISNNNFLQQSCINPPCASGGSPSCQQPPCNGNNGVINSFGVGVNSNTNSQLGFPGFALAIGGCTCPMGDTGCSCMSQHQQQMPQQPTSQFCANPPCYQQFCDNPPCNQPYQYVCRYPPCNFPTTTFTPPPAPTTKIVKILIKKKPKQTFLHAQPQSNIVYEVNTSPQPPSLPPQKVIIRKPAVESAPGIVYKTRQQKVVYASDSEPKTVYASPLQDQSENVVYAKPKPQFIIKKPLVDKPKVLYASAPKETTQNTVIIKRPVQKKPKIIFSSVPASRAPPPLAPAQLAPPPAQVISIPSQTSPQQRIISPLQLASPPVNVGQVAPQGIATQLMQNIPQQKLVLPQQAQSSIAGALGEQPTQFLQSPLTTMKNVPSSGNSNASPNIENLDINNVLAALPQLLGTTTPSPPVLKTPPSLQASQLETLKALLEQVNTQNKQAETIPADSSRVAEEATLTTSTKPTVTPTASTSTTTTSTTKESPKTPIMKKESSNSLESLAASILDLPKDEAIKAMVENFQHAKKQRKIELKLPSNDNINMHHKNIVPDYSSNIKKSEPDCNIQLHKCEKNADQFKGKFAEMTQLIKDMAEKSQGLNSESRDFEDEISDVVAEAIVNAKQDIFLKRGHNKSNINPTKSLLKKKGSLHGTIKQYKTPQISERSDLMKPFALDATLNQSLNLRSSFPNGNHTNSSNIQLQDLFLKVKDSVKQALFNQTSKNVKELRLSKVIKRATLSYIHKLTRPLAFAKTSHVSEANHTIKQFNNSDDFGKKHILNRSSARPVFGHKLIHHKHSFTESQNPLKNFEIRPQERFSKSPLRIAHDKIVENVAERVALFKHSKDFEQNDFRKSLLQNQEIIYGNTLQGSQKNISGKSDFKTLEIFTQPNKNYLSSGKVVIIYPKQVQANQSPVSSPETVKAVEFYDKDSAYSTLENRVNKKSRKNKNFTNGFEDKPSYESSTKYGSEFPRKTKRNKVLQNVKSKMFRKKNSSMKMIKANKFGRKLENFRQIFLKRSIPMPTRNKYTLVQYDTGIQDRRVVPAMEILKQMERHLRLADTNVESTVKQMENQILTVTKKLSKR